MNASSQPSTANIDFRTALKSASVVLRDPNRLDQVLALGDALGRPYAAKRLREFEANPEANEIMRDRPRLDRSHVDYAHLEQLPIGTLGRSYVDLLRKAGISPDSFEEAPATDDERVSYLIMRFRQTHDLWHVLTGYNTDVEGELLLQAFTAAQTHAPLPMFLMTIGSLRYGWRYPRFFLRLREAYRRGRAAKPLGFFYWERYWERPVTELREQLHVVAEPAA